ncbi:hypothetical protein [Streptomyces sp. NRRL B-24484]|uniref:hypothetical protein n=1 Tax=Streptomyces sp. NRRL B-24484 TaxID=1463833 RepID=UPI0004C083B6|nr:hypothetical protein [Streptomyces sp. NRRL B-24484]
MPSPHRFAALAVALGDAGREADAQVLLRNGASRPVGDVAAAAHALVDADRMRELDALLGPLLRARPLQQAVRLAGEDGTLVRVLLDSAGRTGLTAVTNLRPPNALLRSVSEAGSGI